MLDAIASLRCSIYGATTDDAASLFGLAREQRRPFGLDRAAKPRRLMSQSARDRNSRDGGTPITQTPTPYFGGEGGKRVARPTNEQSRMMCIVLTVTVDGSRPLRSLIA